MRAAIYTRVSTDEQVEGYSIDAQLRACRDFVHGKGWAERRAQGLYCGTIPFGVTKGEDGVPIPDTQERNSNVDGTKIPVRKL